MNKNHFFILLLAIFTICFSLSSVAAADYSNNADDIIAGDNSDSVDELQTPNDSFENLTASNSQDSLEVCDSSECLSLSNDSSNDILSSSVVVSGGKTYHILGYTFKVSSSQYKKIKEAIAMGKKQKYLDENFHFTVKTNNVVKVKVLVKSKTYYKKVRYEGLTYYPYTGVKLANLNNYYNNGWKKYSQGFESSQGKSKYYLGYNYVKLKKTVKTYKTVNMPVYAAIGYEGIYDGYGPHYYYPGVDFYAKKAGYPTQYLSCSLITK